MTGINVIGMPFGMHGLGQCMREQVKALSATGMDVCVINENYSSLKRENRDPEISSLLSTRPKYDVNLICHNLPAIGMIARKSPQLLKGRYNIGAPFWEFPQIPKSHLPSLEVLDEIWVGNDFLKSCFRAHTDTPISKLPLALSVAKQGILSRSKRGQKSQLVFGYVFDFNSMVQRKDPICLLIAFLEAFASQSEANVKLVVKFKAETNQNINMSDATDLEKIAALDPRIELINRPMSQTEMTALYDSFDVYVSPHRAEGLGRGIIETMLKAKAVVATGYSGPKEFLLSDHSVALGYDITHVGAAAFGDIKSHFTWADAHIEDVVSALKRFADEPLLARTLGKKAKKFIEDAHGLKAFGHAAQRRLTELAG